MDGPGDAEGTVKTVWDDLQTSVEVARQARDSRMLGQGVHDIAVAVIGPGGNRAQVKTWRTRVYGAVRFGLLETRSEKPGGRATLHLRPLGRRLLEAPEGHPDKRAAMQRAFYNVELFRRVGLRHAGKPLPPLEELDLELSVDLDAALDRGTNARQTMLRSARQAGLIERWTDGTQRLTVPEWLAAELAEEPKPPAEPVGGLALAEPCPERDRARELEAVLAGPEPPRAIHGLGTVEAVEAAASYEPFEPPEVREVRPEPEAAVEAAASYEPFEPPEVREVGLGLEPEAAVAAAPATLLLDGLVGMLPEPGERWPEAARTRWFALARAIFDAVYRP